MVVEGPLNGITVVDLSTIVSGPFGTQMLADFGARIIKVEPPTGDMTRTDVSGLFSALNTGKECVVIDIKNPDDVALLHQLLEKGDVFVENNRPGVVAKCKVTQRQSLAHTMYDILFAFRRPRLGVDPLSPPAYCHGEHFRLRPDRSEFRPWCNECDRRSSLRSHVCHWI